MKRIFLLLLLCNPAYSNTINTTSNSTGSVVNQAVQVVPARQFQYQLGQTIACQSATLAISPFISSTYGFGSPYEPTYQKPVYDTSDNFGLTDADGNDVGDGVPDNPGRVLYYEQTRTGMRSSNTSLNGGITATWSIPLDRAQVRLCRQSMRKQVELYEASLASKRLNYEMSRAKTCADNLQNGFRFKPGTEMARICSDIELITPPNMEHTHAIPKK